MSRPESRRLQLWAFLLALPVLYMLRGGPAYWMLETDQYDRWFWPVEELEAQPIVGNPFSAYREFWGTLFLSPEARNIERSLGVRD